MRLTGSRPGLLAAAAVVAALSSAACGAKRVEVPPAGAEAAAKYPDFIFPAAVPGLGTPAALERHQAGWLWLQAGDLRAAERNFEAALKLSADFYPASVALGYVGLAKNDQREAVEQFDRAIVANPRYVPALVGRGDALLALGDHDQALKSFEAAIVADPSLAPLRTRIEVLRARAQQEDVAAARKAARGRPPGGSAPRLRSRHRGIAGQPVSVSRASATVLLKLGRSRRRPASGDEGGGARADRRPQRRCRSARSTRRERTSRRR